MTQSMVGRQSLCLRLCYRTPAASVRELIPTASGLELVTRGRWAFWQVVVRQVELWRDAERASSTVGKNGAGITYRHISYQLLVRAMTDRADLMCGLYPVRNDEDVSPVSIAAALLLEPAPHRASIRLEEQAGQLAVTVRGCDDGPSDAMIRTGLGPAQRDMNSCFPSMGAAATFFSFPTMRMTIDQASNRLALTRMECQRDRGAASLVSIAQARFEFLEALGQDQVSLEIAQRLTPGQVCWTIERPVSVMPGPLQHQALPYRQNGTLAPADRAQPHAEPVLAM